MNDESQDSGWLAKPSAEERAALRKKLRQRRKAGKHTPMTPFPRPQRIPLSFAQERLWALDRLEPGQVNYNLSTVFRLTGSLDRAALRTAIEAVTERHEALRTRFESDNGKAHQVILPPRPLPLTYHNLTDLPRKNRTEQARRLTDETTRTPFELEQGPLLRVGLWQVDDREHWLVLATHHIVSDGWSDAVFFQEMAAVYNATLQGKRAELLPLSIQYADYSMWQREHVSSAALEHELLYWRQQLEGCPDLGLPLDRSRPKQRRYAGRTVAFQLAAQTVSRLRALSRRQQVTPFMTLLAIFQILLHRLSGQVDFCVGSPIANRKRIETEELIGFFIDMLALRADLSCDPDFRGLLDRVRETSLAAFEHDVLPFAADFGGSQPDSPSQLVTHFPGRLRLPEHARH